MAVATVLRPANSSHKGLRAGDKCFGGVCHLKLSRIRERLSPGTAELV